VSRFTAGGGDNQTGSVPYPVWHGTKSGT
jgi:hypothetical protein